MDKLTNPEIKTTASKNKGLKAALIALLALSVAISLAGAAMLYLAMERELDFDLKHFAVSTTFATIAASLCGAGFLSAVAGAFVVPKGLDLSVGNRDSVPGIISSVFAGCMCALSFVFTVWKGMPESGKAKPGLILAEVSFTVLAAVYFILRGSGLFIKKPALALSGLLPALMSAFALLNLYFDENDPLNAPLKIYRTIMIATFMLFFTAEAGISIGRPKMNGKFVFASLFTISSGGIIALSRLLARITDPDHFGYDVIEVSLFAALWLYALIIFTQKLIISLKTPCENPDEAALSDNESETASDDEDSSVSEEADDEAETDENADEESDGEVEAEEDAGAEPGDEPDTADDKKDEESDSDAEAEEETETEEEVEEKTEQSDDKSEDAEAPDTDE